MFLWREGVSLWYAEDYLTAMSVWHDALEDLLVDPIHFPWERNDSSDNTRQKVEVASTRDAKEMCPLIPLFLFLAGCYLDAQEFAMAEKCCRQGFQLLLLQATAATTATGISNNNEMKDLGVRLAQELMSCWEENPDMPSHCQESRNLILWLKTNEHLSWIGDFWQDAWQRPAFVYQHCKIPSQAHCPSEDHPAWCRTLENHFDSIRGECEVLLIDWRALARVGDGHHRQGAGSHDGTVVSEGGDWREVVLFGTGAAPSNVAPKTRALLQAHCPDAVSLADQGGGEVIFSILAPNTSIAPHCASTNLRWTAHLGLVVPTRGRAQIRVADEWHTWQEGKMLVFDDSFEHEVVNESLDEIRVVLLMRFWNPNLSSGARRTALQEALDWKAKEQERRFYPPAPPTDKF